MAFEIALGPNSHRSFPSALAFILALQRDDGSLQGAFAVAFRWAAEAAGGGGEGGQEEEEEGGNGDPAGSLCRVVRQLFQFAGIDLARLVLDSSGQEEGGRAVARAGGGANS